MARPLKKNAIKQITDVEEIKQLALEIVEFAEMTSLEIEDPFEGYAHQLRMHWHEDIKIFNRNLIRGYEALLEELRLSLPPNKN